MLIAFDNPSISHDRFLSNRSSLVIKKNIPYLSKVVTIKLCLSIYLCQLINMHPYVEVNVQTCIAKGDSVVNCRCFDIVSDSGLIAYICAGECMEICKNM
jgi:hypothetical protein